MVDWEAWHERYGPPGSPLARRLIIVQRLIGRWLDRTAPRPVRVLSVCAGDGRDVLQTLAGRRGAARVAVTLLEQDPRLCARARAFAADNGLDVDARATDASVSDSYAGLGRFDLVLLVGMFGNIGDDDIRVFVEMLPALCAPDATVVWSRRPKGDLLAQIDGWFAANSFVETFATRDQRQFHVTSHRFTGAPRALEAGVKLFTFVF